MSKAPDEGIYYYLGDNSSHFLHARPLYEKLGGTFVVSTKRCERSLRQANVPVIRLDNVRPGLRKQTDRIRIRLGGSGKNLRLGREVSKTFRFLEENARVVLFYELYEFSRYTRLTRPKKIYLTHGMMIKGFFTMHPKRLQMMEEYDFMAAMGPAIKRRLIREGLDPAKLVDISIARNDEVIARRTHAGWPKELAGRLGVDPARPAFAYLPTFWGPSSIYSVGLKIVENFPEQYTLIFRPHPQTPEKLLKEYKRIIKTKPNVVFAPEGAIEGLDLLDVYALSAGIIGDVSSIMMEAILLEKPLIFAYDEGEHRQNDADYEAIEDVVAKSQKIDLQNAGRLEEILTSALKNGIDKKIWSATIKNSFYHANGTSTRAIAEFIRRLAD